jgi:hypothetical protein
MNVGRGLDYGGCAGREACILGIGELRPGERGAW